MTGEYQLQEKDRILGEAFGKLRARGLSSSWASSPTPYSALRRECRVLMRSGASETGGRSGSRERQTAVGTPARSKDVVASRRHTQIAR